MDISQNNLPSDNFIWQQETKQNRIQSFAFVIAVAVCVLFSICFTASSFAGLEKSQEVSLESRINPNNAPAASLVRLPGVGVSRAGAIVAYRDDFIEQGKGNNAFQNCGDLQKVKGIGPKTSQNICEWLKFE
ncbi:MAG: ComEA family DNA-binding protein [Planctomycetota bacterium]|jgi:competence protein ComEA